MYLKVVKLFLFISANVLPLLALFVLLGPEGRANNAANQLILIWFLPLIIAVISFYYARRGKD
jgi:hypothetical protein